MVCGKNGDVLWESVMNLPKQLSFCAVTQADICKTIQMV